MGQAQKMIDIVNTLEEQFQAIDGDPDYFNDIDHEVIYKKHVDFDVVDTYPAITISSMSTTKSVPMDQVTYQSPLNFEIYGYIVEEDGDDGLITTLKLAQDMEKAIYQDDTLNGNVYDLSLSINAATLENYGIVKMTVSANMCYAVEE